jgi:KDO2-lipid IV(A) lauroyltransferase
MARSSRRGESWKETGAFWSYRALERAAMAVPERIGRRAAAALGDAAFRRLGRMRAAVARNQARVLGLDPADERVRASTREAFRLYARCWYDSFRLRAMSPAAIHAHTDVRDFHHVETALAAGQGCIAVLPHMGNWDLAGRFLAANGHRVASVAEELKPHRLFELFSRHRRELGIHILPLADTARLRPKLERLLSENWVVALLADRDLTGRGVEIEMFGAPRRVPAGPALLSLTTGTPLLVGSVYTTRDGWRIEVSPPLAATRSGDLRTDVQALSQQIATAFERAIVKQPADWHLFEAGWPETDAAAR